MLILRQEQLDIIRTQAFARFEDELVLHLLTNYPGPAAAIGAEAEIRAFVKRVIGRAAGLGIDTAGGVTLFAELLLQYGEQFERSPDRVWATNMLANTALPGHVRVGAIRDRLAERSGGRVLVRF